MKMVSVNRSGIKPYVDGAIYFPLDSLVLMFRAEEKEVSILSVYSKTRINHMEFSIVGSIDIVRDRFDKFIENDERLLVFECTKRNGYHVYNRDETEVDEWRINNVECKGDDV